MALTVISRPSKDIDGVTSTWNAVNLPIQYKFNSDLFPTNTVDPIESVTPSNNKGFLQLTIGNPIANVLQDETVNLTNSNIESYNGVWRVKEVISTTEFVLFASFDANLLPLNIQKYYNNYFTEVKVFSGLPSWHSEEADKPISEVGTLRAVPNSDNDIIASFSGIIKSDVNLKNDNVEGIDINHFTGFYVQWREGYDQNVDGNIVTNYTEWEVDELDTCGNEIIDNGDFDTDLSDWSQIDASIPSEDFVWNAGKAESNLNTLRKSKILYQEVNLVANIEYNISVDVTRSNSKSSKFVIYGSNDLDQFYILYSNDSTSNLAVSESIVPTIGYKYIGYHFYRTTSTTNTTVTLDNISVIPSICEYTFWASNSSLQFQNSRGGNMYDYVALNANSKFMTNFDKPTYFSGEQFDLSIILDSDPLLLLEIEDTAFMWLDAADISQADGTDVLSWVDRSGNVNVVNGTDAPSYKVNGINGLPSVSFIDQEILTTDSNITTPLINYICFSFNDTAAVPFPKTFTIYGTDIFSPSGTDSVAQINGSFDNNLIIFTGSGGVMLGGSLTENTTYVLKIVQDGVNSTLYINNVFVSSQPSTAGYMENMTLGQTTLLTEYTKGGLISEFITVPADIDECTKWRIESYLGNKYDAYPTSLFAYQLTEYDKLGNELGISINNIDYKDSGVYRISPDISNNDTNEFDLSLVSAAECIFSETKRVLFNDKCSNQEIYLTWLNPEDGWEYWKFTAEKDYNLNIESKETIKRNIFNDWDNDFINGDTESDVINSSAYSEVGVFSQYLNEDEVRAISTIKYSSRVQVIDGLKRTTVIVDSDSVLLFNDGDDETLHTIGFNIRYPNIQIQSQ